MVHGLLINSIAIIIILILLQDGPPIRGTRWYWPGYLWGRHDLDGSEKRLKSRLDPKNDMLNHWLPATQRRDAQMSHVKANIFGPIGKDRLVTVGHSTPHQNDMKPCPARNEAAEGSEWVRGILAPIHWLCSRRSAASDISKYRYDVLCYFHHCIWSQTLKFDYIKGRGKGAKHH